jgi:hypothetical protein
MLAAPLVDPSLYITVANSFQIDHRRGDIAVSHHYIPSVTRMAAIGKISAGPGRPAESHQTVLADTV